ncbi:hypothetical protein HU200_023058 [Digitaria exilis]|uniref:Uncharacterized protein n=1 Tax=Digitaria exilis TaxID=1010633 RepID=A0A835C261_9POAL|nr:hypothetical protein HU200_023058 [Digitaria exilis]
MARAKQNKTEDGAKPCGENENDCELSKKNPRTDPSAGGSSSARRVVDRPTDRGGDWMMDARPTFAGTSCESVREALPALPSRSGRRIPSRWCEPAGGPHVRLPRHWLNGPHTPPARPLARPIMLTPSSLTPTACQVTRQAGRCETRSLPPPAPRPRAGPWRNANASAQATPRLLFKLPTSLPHSSHSHHNITISPTPQPKRSSLVESNDQAAFVADRRISIRYISAAAMAAGKAAAAAAAPAPVKKKKPSFGTRAWRLLRLAVLWARRGGAAHSLRLLRTLRRHGHGIAGGGGRGDRLRYGEREFSIDETPAFRFRTPSARVLRLIPCIAPAVPDTPGLYGDDRYFFRDAAARELEEEEDDDEAPYGYRGEREGDDDQEGDELLSSCGGDDDEELLERVVAEACRASTGGGSVGGEDAGVDVKAEEFIARFYAQMKLQRQISWLQYNEMMQRSWQQQGRTQQRKTDAVQGSRARSGLWDERHDLLHSYTSLFMQTGLLAISGSPSGGLLVLAEVAKRGGGPAGTPHTCQATRPAPLPTAQRTRTPPVIGQPARNMSLTWDLILSLPHSTGLAPVDSLTRYPTTGRHVSDNGCLLLGTVEQQPFSVKIRASTIDPHRTPRVPISNAALKKSRCLPFIVFPTQSHPPPLPRQVALLPPPCGPPLLPPSDQTGGAGPTASPNSKSPISGPPPRSDALSRRRRRRLSSPPSPLVASRVVPPRGRLELEATSVSTEAPAFLSPIDLLRQ